MLVPYLKRTVSFSVSRKLNRNEIAAARYV
jgi:hypothetical protein